MTAARTDITSSLHTITIMHIKIIITTFFNPLRYAYHYWYTNYHLLVHSLNTKSNCKKRINVIN